MEILNTGLGKEKEAKYVVGSTLGTTVVKSLSLNLDAKPTPCSVRVNGQPCWGVVSDGTGCTNPDCPRNNMSGGF